MKVVIALDSFKGCMDAVTACRITADAIAAVGPGVQTVIRPMADGGEGTVAALMAGRTGCWLERQVTGPLPEMNVRALLGWFDCDKTAVIEMASASGLPLLEPHQRNPLKTTTYGTGELIKAAIENGAKRLLLGVGGSATVDAGTGAATALGWRFLDEKNKPVGLGGGQLSRIKKIISPANLDLPQIEVLCDVETVLYGGTGAAEIYGPQKGATPQMVRQLDEGLRHLAEVVKLQLGKEINIPRAGAAGGLAAGAMAFMNAALVSGIERIIEATNLAAELAGAQWVITGEGCFDRQSLYGKVVSGVAAAAKKTDTAVAVLAGTVALSEQEYKSAGISQAVALKKEGMSLDYAVSHSRQLLAQATAEFAQKHLTT
ncbi:MAG TPA: glycerate kinase [Sedimentisphaerales bacterium]|nr:glycerate kinase [Sedimentisphaerales bacterium]